jgi:uncharacterized protein
MRDPGGAIVALAKQPRGVRATNLGPDVVWYELNTADVQRAQSNYGELFGWEFNPPLDLESLGVSHPFAWERGAPLVGAMIDISARPGVHPHWLFYFRVAALALAVDAIRAAGGIVIGQLTVPTGAQIAVCDDPQGAAFAIQQGRAAAR